MSGCKVADGNGVMLVGFLPNFSCSIVELISQEIAVICMLFSYCKVTGVGVNTEWGLLMASISEDNGEETPLQVDFLVHC